MPFKFIGSGRAMKSSRPKYYPPSSGPFGLASRRAIDLERVRHKAAMRTIAKLGSKWRAKKAAKQKWADSWARGMNRSSRKRYK